MTATPLNQSAIWYSACNEDTASEIAALEPAGKRVLCITASGSRAFDLLLADPAHILAIDENPAQTALAELYAAAYRHYDYRAFSALLGLTESSQRRVLLENLLPYISEAARAFWLAHVPLADEGLLYCGRWEGFMRRMMRWSGQKRRQLAQRLLACDTEGAQWQLWQTMWDDWQWRLFLRGLTCRALWRWVFREPGIAFIPQSFDMASYARARFEHAAKNLHLRQLPFAWLVLTGAYSQDALPPYLTEAGHAIIRERLGRLTLKTASLQETVAADGPDLFDAVSLSDYSSYCDAAEQARVWQNLTRKVSQNGRVCERKFFNKSGAEAPSAAGFLRLDALENRLNMHDGAWFYTFVVAQKETSDVV
jgi:S-adenosylmethionine-diacylglycerol 3-amino-3-carboxypropyl transferase